MTVEVHNVRILPVPEAPGEEAASWRDKVARGRWRAVCSCGWTAAGTKLEVELKASSHDL